MKKGYAAHALLALSLLLGIGSAHAENWEYGHLRCETSYPGGSELLHHFYQGISDHGEYDRCTWKNQWGSVVGDGKKFVRAYNFLAEKMPDKGFTAKEVEYNLPTGETYERPYGVLALYTQLLARENPGWKQPGTISAEPGLSTELQQRYQEAVYVAQVVQHADDAMTLFTQKKKPIPEPTLNGILNLLGSKGWEVVSTTPGQTASMFSKEVLLKKAKLSAK